MTVRVDTPAHEKLVVNDKAGLARHHYRKDRERRSTPGASAKHRLGSEAGKKVKGRFPVENNVVQE